MQSIINGYRKYNINEKTGSTEDILAFYPESYINNGENYSSIKEEEIICNFLIKEKLGEGAFGSVRLGINKQTGEKVAIKILEKSKITKYEDKLRIEREINILKKLRHPNIVHLYSIIETEKQILLITEYIKGQELFQYILLKKRLSEEEACFYFSQIVSGIEYLHKLKIAHRDIKSENIIIEQNTKLIKIIDFGLSNTYGDKDEEMLRSSCGSPLYAAPEMVKGDIYKGSTVDIWSMGVVLYYMICGCFPFQEEDNSKLFKKIIQGKFTIPMHVSTQGRELLYKLLEINPRKRINISQIKRNSWIKIYCPKEINFNGRIFDIGLNLNKYVVPIDEEIVEELSSKYNLSKVKIRISILMNKSNDYTTLYEILLNKKILEGKKSVADLKSDLFFSYIRDKKNFLANYNNDIKKVINERKMGLEDDKNSEKIVKNELVKNKNLIKSQEDLNKINFHNNLNDLDINSPKYTPKINVKDDINNNYNNRNKNILDIKFNTIIEAENDLKLSSFNKQKLKNYNTPLLKTKKEKKFNNVNSKNSNKNEKLKRNNITSSSKRNKLNSLDKNLKSDKNVKCFINDYKIKKNIKRRKYESLDLSKTEKTKINEILNNKYNFNNSISNNKENVDENNNNLETKENQNNIENFNFKEKFKKLLSENLINNNEEKNDFNNEIKNEIHNDRNEENKENESPNNNVNENNLVKNDASEISKSNNYLTTDEKIKYAQTLDSFSLKNSNEDNLYNNYSIQNVNLFSFLPKKQENKNDKTKEEKNKKIFHKAKPKYKVYNNRINLIKHKLQIEYNKEYIIDKRDRWTNKTQHIFSQSEEKRKYLDNRKTKITPIKNKTNLKRITNIKFIDTENFNNKKMNEKTINIQRQKRFNIRKYNSINKEFKTINLERTFTVKREKNINLSIKRYKKRNNKIFSPNTQKNEDLTLFENKRKNSMCTNKRKKQLNFKEKSDDLIINRNDKIKKSNSLLLMEKSNNKYSFSNNDPEDLHEISNIEQKKENKIKDLRQGNNVVENFNSFFSEKDKKINKEIILKEMKQEMNFIPFDLSCIFLSSRKQLKQKIVNICDKMKYKIKFISLYKFNIIPGDKLDNIFEVNLPKNKLGIINFSKDRLTNLEQTNHIRKIISKIK